MRSRGNYDQHKGIYTHMEFIQDSVCRVHGYYHQMERGRKRYEFGNHLGNVLTVISDGWLTRCVGDSVVGYQAQVVSATDYSAFGAIMPGRSFNAGDYRFGFSGVEQDNEIKGVGNSLDMKFRIYDPRLGRFLSTDPLEKMYAWNSTYAYAMNRVIDGIDIEGKEYLRADESRLEVTQGRARLKLQNFSNPYQNQFNKQYPFAKYFDYYDAQGNLKPNAKDVFVFGTQKQIQAYNNNFKPTTPKAETVGPNNQSESPTAPTPGGTRAAAGAIGAINVINFGLETTMAMMLYYDASKLSESKTAFNSAFGDLQTAIAQGLVDPKYQNTNDLSQILNVILQ